jgi:hypothetical protein
MWMKSDYGMLLLTCSLAAACATNGGDAAVPVASLSGTWTLNETQTSGVANLSSSPFETRDTVRGLPAPLREPPVERVREVLEVRAERLSIVHDSVSVTFRFNGNGVDSPQRTTRTQSTTARDSENAVVVALVPDWRMVRTVWVDGDSAEIRARWENGRLRVERRLDDGITVSEYYSRGAGAPYLVQYVVARGSSGSEVTVRRVYDRTE